MSRRQKNLTLLEACDILDDIQCHSAVKVYIEPPSCEILTDEEDGDVDNPTINDFSKRQLEAGAEIVYENEDDYEITESVQHLNKRRKQFDWNAEEWTIEEEDCFPSVDSNVSNLNEVQLFELFWNNAIIDLIIEESAKYALMNGWPDPQITHSEFKIFCSILIISGYSPKPSKADHWSNGESLRNSMIYNAMRRNRFDTIMRCLHINSVESKQDKFYKLRPLIKHLQSKFFEFFQPQRYISHDEAMIAYFGKHSCKQSNRLKPIRFGYKVWCQNSPDGYLVAFDLYQGKTQAYDQSLVDKFGKCSATVLELINTYPDKITKLPFHFITDNLFTTLQLLFEMKNRNYNCTGTMRSNRLGSECILSSVNEMNKNDERGSMEYCTVSDGNQKVILTRWKDNNIVTMGSTLHGCHQISEVSRYSKALKKRIHVPIPKSVQVYNRNMGGTDRMDQNISYYRISIRGKKWWWSIFTWLLDASINNAWMLAKKSDVNLSQLSYRIKLADYYCNKYQNQPKGTGRKTKNANDSIRLDGTKHFITVSEKRRRCAGNACKSVVSSECLKCNVGICIKCYKSYHTM